MSTLHQEGSNHYRHRGKGLGESTPTSRSTKFLRALQGAIVMAEAQGRKTRSLKRLGVASYSGRQGRTHYFSVAYDDGSSELLTAAQLKSRVTTLRQPKSSAAVSITNHVSLCHCPSHAVKVIECFKHVMPGVHDECKYRAVALAAQNNRAYQCSVDPTEVKELCESVCMNLGSLFLPWRWCAGALEVLRLHGCSLRVSRDEESFEPVHRKSFE